MKTEAELISSVKAGITSAFDTLFGMYSHKIYSFAFSILKSKEDAEDVVQHTFFKVWEKRESITGNLVFKSFLYTIAYNFSIDILRIRLKEKVHRDSIIVQATSNYNLEERIEFGDLLVRVNQIAEKLPPRKREIYQLSRIHNLSYSEVLLYRISAINTQMPVNKPDLYTTLSLRRGQGEVFWIRPPLPR